MKTDITAAELEAQVREVASENPDTVYEKVVVDTVGNTACVYFDAAGNPSCLIGKGLAKLGIVVEDFTDSENFMAIAELLQLWSGTPCSETRWLSEVQLQQDRAENWSYAVRYADHSRAKSDG